jgi:hypothetical protein
MDRLVNSTPQPLYRRVKPGTHGIGGWGGPRAGRVGGPQGRSGRVRKISPQPGFDLRTVQHVASRYTDWSIPAHEDSYGNEIWGFSSQIWHSAEFLAPGPAAIYPQRNSLVLISVRGGVDCWAAESRKTDGMGHFKKFPRTLPGIEPRTSHSCGAVPQLTTPLAPNLHGRMLNSDIERLEIDVVRSCDAFQSSAFYWGVMFRLCC